MHFCYNFRASIFSITSYIQVYTVTSLYLNQCIKRVVAAMAASSFMLVILEKAQLTIVAPEVFFKYASAAALCHDIFYVSVCLKVEN